MKRRLRQLRQKLVGRAPRTQPGDFRADRARVVQTCVFGLFGVIATRAVVLHLFPSHVQALHQLADTQYQREIELSPYRGGIYDQRGEPLAISIKRPSLAVNPHVFDPTPRETLRLARILKTTPARIRQFAKKKSYFAWLARQLDPHVADEVENLGLTGLTVINEPARYYPAGSAAANLLGFMGLDDHGLAGLERQFDKELHGKAYKVKAEKDAKGNFILNETVEAKPERTGNNIYLTLDRVIQEIAEDELQAGVKKASAKHGFAIVSDPHTGRILAVANYPTFDPNDSRHLDIAETRNGAFLDTYEPGSVVKPFVIGSAIERKSTTPDEMHDCDKGALRIGRHTIHDHAAAESLSTADTLIRSSNICTYKIASKMGREATYDALQSFGLAGGASLLGFPGETGGRISDWRKWAQIRFANVAFGHGFVVTGLELTQAMGAIANGGHLMKPTLIERIVSSDGLVVTSTPTQVVRDVLSPQVARTMRGLLRRVVTDPHGTGKPAQAASYTVAGKTGTAQKVDPVTHAYTHSKYDASFIGFAPAEDPHIVIYVMVDEPGKGYYYGGEAAGPIFAKIAERTLKYLNVAPDLPQQPEKVTKRPRVAETSVHAGSAKDARKL